MKSNILDKQASSRACTGCSTCEAICPKNAINIKLSKDGFYKPRVNNDLCVECGLCKKICYKFDENIFESKQNEYLSYSAMNKEKFELETATSGGVSIELMKECISQGYKVVGVGYDYKKDIAITKIASRIEELQEFKGSKYFQSYTCKAFDKMVNDKTSQKYAIFGTPCQIYSISKLSEIQNNREKYMFIDLFCHGCPTINLWRKYLEGVKLKFNKEHFDKIEFRSKAHGWHEYVFKFYKDDRSYISQKTNNQFYELFFDMNTHNEACYKCKLRSTFAYTDIRLGDFWGYQYDDNSMGVSAVIITSDNGKTLFNNIKDKLILNNHSIEETIQGQSYGKVYDYDIYKRQEIIRMLASEKSIDEIIKIYRNNYTFKKKIKIVSKNVVKKLPQGMYFKLKKIIHKF